MPFGGNSLGSVFKAFIMFTGEYDFGSIRFTSSNNTTKGGRCGQEEWDRLMTDIEVLYNNDSTYHQKAEILLGQLIFVAFVFLFSVVVMNLLNAFAIGDIQVTKFWYSKSSFISLRHIYFVQNLRDDATAIRNRKKIKELIEQKPDVHLKYYWNIVYHEAKAQSETFFIRSLVEKARDNQPLAT